MDFLDVAELLVRIDAAIQHDRTTDALRLILSNFSHLRDPAPLRERVAAVLADRGDLDSAVELYERTGLHYANDGRPTQSLAVAHKIGRLEASNDSLLERITALYSRRSPFLAEEARAESLEGPEGTLDLDAQEPQLDVEMLLEMATERALRAGYVASEPRELPAIPLLSQLPSEVFRETLDALELLEYSDVTPVIEAGDVSDRLLWTVSPDVTIGRDDPTYRLPPGAVLGTNGFGTMPIPNRQTLVARDGSRLLALPGERVETLSERFESFEATLEAFRRDAMIESFLEQHALFEPFDDEGKLSLLKRFSGVELDDEVSLVPRDEESPGLFVLLDGRAELVRSEDDWTITVLAFTPGDVFGGLGLVADKPESVHVDIEPPSQVLFLPRESFDVVAGQQPEFAKYVVNLTHGRLDDLETSLSANDLSEVD